MLNSSNFLCTLFKAWQKYLARLQEACVVLSFSQHITLDSVPLHTPWLIFSSRRSFRIFPVFPLPWCGAGASGSPICHQPFALPDLPPVSHQWEMLSTFWVFRGETQVFLITLRARNFLSKRAVFHIVISFHGRGRT